MENMTQIAKQRAERLKRHQYSTPLPFDILAQPRLATSVASSASSPSTQKSSLDRPRGQHSDNGSSSDRSQASTDPSSYSDGSPVPAHKQRQTAPPKHVPLHQLVDFRVAHTRQPRSLSPKEPLPVRRPAPSDSRPHEQKQPSPQRIIRDGVPHLMTRESSVLVESVEGVPLTTTLNSYSNPGNHPTLPEFEADEVREIDLPTEADDQRLEAEFERYRRHFARPPPAIWHGPQHADTAAQRTGRNGKPPGMEAAPWTKDGWKTRTRQISPRPVNKGADHVFVDGYSNADAATTAKGQGKGDGKRDTATMLGRGSIESQAPSLRSEKSAAPAPTVPLLRR